MGENNDSSFENVLLKNIDEDTPINVDKLLQRLFQDSQIIKTLKLLQWNNYF